MKRLFRTWSLFWALTEFQGLSALEQSLFQSVFKHCRCSWEIVETKNWNGLKSSALHQCSSACLAKAQDCDGILTDETGDSCHLVNTTSRILCYEQFATNNDMENILLGNHNIRSIDSDLFVGFLNSTEAYSLTDLSKGLPSRTISVPTVHGAFKGLTLMFDNGVLACVGHPMVCHHWNTANNTWVDFPSPNYSHLQGGLVLFDGAPMLVAGWDGVNAAQNVDSVETYDLNSKTWKPGVTLPKPMRSTIIQALNETIVIVSGGYGDTKPLKETYKLVAKSTVWERLEDLPFTWSSQASTVLSLPGLGKGIFAVGYYCGSDHLFERKAWFMAEFDLTWRRLEAFDLPTDLSIMEGQIYRVVDKVIAVPDYEAIAGGSNGFKVTMKILTKNVLNLSNPWMIHETDVALSGKATYALTVMEYVMA